jgi:carbon monoxide dehydrogenase subunit G
VPEIERQVSVPVELGATWRFVADMNNWAADIPGYRQHTMVNDRESIWVIRGDVGMLSREAELQVTITEWDEPRAVSFTLEGTEEPISGRGRFSTESSAAGETQLGFQLSLSAGGAMGPVIDALLGTQLPKIAERFVEALSADILRSADSDSSRA